MSLSQTTIQGSPFRPFEDHYLITSFQDERPADRLPSLLSTTRALLWKRRESAERAAA